MTIKIHAIKTGLVRLKSSQPVRRKGGLIRILNDTQWEGWFPIYAWVIDHPEGVIVVDTGDTSETTSDPNYFPKWHPYFRTSVQMDIKSHEEIGPQLKAMGIGQKDVKKVILTHFHTDHAGGLHHFPDSWPKWFNPTSISFNYVKFGPFEKSYTRITNSGDVIVIPTPGHTPNHISVIVNSEDKLYFLAGDTTYSEELLIKNIPDGVSPRVSKTLNTMAKIRKLANTEPLIYLPSHDEKSAERLAQTKILAKEENVTVPAA
jgi:glyoxylase-like metal-dependent hydrolase (beta-lactamase superfamily II)